MLKQWLQFSLAMARRPADFYSGARKIIRATDSTFHSLGPTLTMHDCGFTKSKMSMLTRNYLNDESRNAATKLWEGRLERNKYGSVGFSCYNHLIKGQGLGYGISSKQTGIPPRPGGMMGGRRVRLPKGHPRECKCGDCTAFYNRDIQPKNKRASVMGPCIQAVTLTLLPKGGTAIDVFYRTTELFKKFPADLVFLRDILLPPFELERSPIKEVTFHFANITCHPMYFVTLIPSLDDPLKEFEELRKRDKYFFDWTVKWTARYLVPEYFRGIDKFAQAMRVRKDALERIDKATLRDVIKYLKKHHPGYRNEYTAPEENEEE